MDLSQCRLNLRQLITEETGLMKIFMERIFSE